MLKKREERIKNNPDFAKRIDPEINRGRINFVLFGDGEEHGERYEDYGGSIAVMSFDLITKKISVAQFSRDKRYQMSGTGEKISRFRPKMASGKIGLQIG